MADQEIYDLLREIELNELVLPEFQREFVWNRDQARGLIDSLFREFPTGSLLLWKTTKPPALKNKDYKSDAGSVKVILDGQQRLTTLFLLVKDAIPPFYAKKDIAQDPRNLYFDLRTGKFMYYKKSEMGGKANWMAVTDCFTKEVNYGELANKIRQPNEELGSLIALLVTNRDKLRNILRFKYPLQFVPPNAKLKEAVDIFDAVNSQGTKLTDAELALAYITSNWSDARREFKKKLEELKEVGFYFDLDFIVRCLTGVLSHRARFELIHDVEKDKLIVGWERLSKILDYVVNILKSKMHISSTHDLNTPNVLVPFVVYVHQKCSSRTTFDLEEKELVGMQKWIYLASIWARYSGSPTQTLDRDLTLLDEPSPSEKLIGEIMAERGRIKLSEADLRGKGVLHPLYPMFKVLVMKNGAVDWSNGIPISETVGAKFKIESHHLFPKSELYKDKFNKNDRDQRHIVNEIANRVFLTSDANRGFFSRPPEQVLPEVEKKHPGELEKQYIPLNRKLWKKENYEPFLRERRRLIAEGINKFLDGLSGLPPADENVSGLLKKPEGQHLEFKSTLRFSTKGQVVDASLEKACLKTICAFMNADGGILIVGVSDDRKLLGLEDDYKSLKKPDSDGFENHLSNLVSARIGNEFLNFIEVSFENTENREICKIKVHPSNKAAILKEGIMQEFYVRHGNNSRLYSWPEAIEYIREHWK